MTSSSKIHGEYDLNHLMTQFLQCVPLRHFDWSCLDPIAADHWSLDAQNAILEHTLLHSLQTKYPLHEDYQRKFAKAVISRIESDEQEVDERFYSFVVVVVTSTTAEDSPSPFAFKHYALPAMRESQFLISIQENVNSISEGTTGLKTWPASLKLMAHLSTAQGQSLILDQSVLELGSGVGLLGLSCAYLGASQVLLTEMDHPVVMEKLGRNLALNRERLESLGKPLPRLQSLDWEQGIPLKGLGLGEEWDVVLCADVVYDPSLVGPLAKTLHALLTQHRVSQAILSQTVRQASTLQLFIQTLETLGLSIERIPFSEEEVDKTRVFVDERREGVVHLFRIISTLQT
jgi:predicted nicotinamide N-methyase